MNKGTTELLPFLLENSWNSEKRKQSLNIPKEMSSYPADGFPLSFLLIFPDEI